MAERRALASVFVDGDDGTWCVAETPSEVAEKVRVAWDGGSGDMLIELTLANEESAWNGRSVFIRADTVRAVAPPMSGG